MKHGTDFMKRSRGRNRRTGGNNQNNFNNPNRHFESVGPDVKIRGSAQQVLEKYQQYARDAHTSGDRILSEAYYQFAEHYQRIVAKQTEARDRQQQPRNNRDDRDQGRRDNSRNDGDDNSDDGNQDEDEVAETATEASVERRDTAPSEDDRDDNAMRVIDENESSDDTEASSDAEKEPRRKPARRKPYKKQDKEESKDSDPADGVMKTLSRGRRKSSDEGAEVPAETTD
jgi:hypothetical protein